MILALDTTTRTGSLALLRADGSVVFAERFHSDRSHNSALFGPLETMLKLAGGGLRAIVAGRGPGSYTGARVGISAALGVSMTFDIPLIGRSSWLGLESSGGEKIQNALILGDARRGFWIARNVDVAMTSDPADSFSNDWELFDAAERDKRAAAALAQGRDLVSVESGFQAAGKATSIAYPSAVLLAEPYCPLSDEQLQALAGATPDPVYLQGPLVTMPSRR